LRDHRELLKRRDDDRLARLQCILELARRRVDVLDHTQCLLELPDGRLKLPIEYAPVGDDDDRIKDPLVLRVVERRKLMRQPGDREAPSAARGVLDEVSLPGGL